MEKKYPVEISFIEECKLNEDKYPELGITIVDSRIIKNARGEVIYTCKKGRIIKEFYSQGKLVVEADEKEKNFDESKRVLRLAKENDSSDTYSHLDVIAENVRNVYQEGSIYKIHFKTKKRYMFIDNNGKMLGDNIIIYDGYTDKTMSSNGRFKVISPCYAIEASQNNKCCEFAIDNNDPDRGMIMLDSSFRTKRVSNDGYVIGEIYEEDTGQRCEALYSIKANKYLLKADVITVQGLNDSNNWEEGVVFAITDRYKHEESSLSRLTKDGNIQYIINPSANLLGEKSGINVPYYPYIVVKANEEYKYSLGYVDKDKNTGEYIPRFFEIDPTEGPIFVPKKIEELSFAYKEIEFYPDAGVIVLEVKGSNMEIVYHPRTNQVIYSHGPVTVENNIVTVKETIEGDKETSYVSTPEEIVEFISLVDKVNVYPHDQEGYDLVTTEPPTKGMLVRRKVRPENLKDYSELRPNQ